MAYPSMRNPREVRSHLHTVYNDYVHGDTLFPRWRLKIAPEALPKKTQEIAGRLALAWSEIDLDRRYFESAAMAMGQTLKAEFDASGGEEARSVLVVTNCGRNALRMGVLRVEGGTPTLRISTWPRGLFLETYQGHEFGVVDGQSISLQDGHIVGQTDTFVVRESNASGLFGMSPESTEHFLRELAS